jgi:hypothetical protein
VTHAVIVPTMLQMILDSADGTASDLGSIRGLNTDGSPLSATLLERARERFADVFYPIYEWRRRSPAPPCSGRRRSSAPARSSRCDRSPRWGGPWSSRT